MVDDRDGDRSFVRLVSAVAGGVLVNFVAPAVVVTVNLNLLFVNVMTMAVTLVSLRAVARPGVVVLAGSVNNRVKAVLVGSVGNHSHATARFLHAVLAGHATTCGAEKERRGSRQGGVNEERESQASVIQLFVVKFQCQWLMFFFFFTSRL